MCVCVATREDFLPVYPPTPATNIKSSFKCSPHPGQKLVPWNSKQTLPVSKETTAASLVAAEPGQAGPSRAEALSFLPRESRLYLPLRLKAVGMSGGESGRPVKRL